MPVTRVVYESIVSLYGDRFATMWFRPVSKVFKG